jgi:predicted amidohydrolase YtcJ
MTNAGKALDNKPGMLAYQRLARRGELQVRINNMIRLPIRVAPEAEVLDFLNSLLYISFSSDYLRVGTLKIAVDGSGYQVPRDTIRRVLKEAHKAGWQMFIHLGAPGSFDMVTDALEEAYREFPRDDARHVITHARNPSPKNIAVLKKYGVMVEPQPPGPLRTYLDSGVVVMTGTDQKPIGPLMTIWSAVNNTDDEGKVVNEKEKITLQEAIRAVTSVPAWGSFEESVKGSIEVGKFADLVVLGRDIMTVPSMEIRDIPVLMTMVGGKWRYVNPNKDPRQKVTYMYWG